MLDQFQPSAQAVRLLEADPDLGQDLDDEAHEIARRDLIVRAGKPTWKRRDGVWGPEDPRGYTGLLVLEGLLLRTVFLEHGTSAELLGVGDLLRPWDVDGVEFLPAVRGVEWSILSDLKLAVLDASFTERASRWPTVLSQVIARGVIRAKSNTVSQAISHVRGIESRLILLFWHYAGRWGKVGRDAIGVELPLTHEVIARLVGASRPSVTTALTQLSADGLLTRDGGVWRLSRDSAERVEAA